MKTSGTECVAETKHHLQQTQVDYAEQRRPLAIIPEVGTVNVTNPDPDPDQVFLVDAGSVNVSVCEKVSDSIHR